MEQVLLTGTDREVFWCLFILPPWWQADADSSEGEPPIMVTPHQSPLPFLFLREQEMPVRLVNLYSFFSLGFPSKHKFLLMSCTKGGKTLMSVSACRFARDLQ